MIFLGQERRDEVIAPFNLESEVEMCSRVLQLSTSIFESLLSVSPFGASRIPKCFFVPACFVRLSRNNCPNQPMILYAARSSLKRDLHSDRLFSSSPVDIPLNFSLEINSTSLSVTAVVNMYKFPSCFLASLVDHVLICSLFSSFARIYLGVLNGLFPFAFLNGPKRPTSLNYAQEKVQKPIVWRMDTRRREERKRIKVLHWERLRNSKSHFLSIVVFVYFVYLFIHSFGPRSQSVNLI